MFAVIAGIPIVVHDNCKSSNTFCLSILTVSSIPVVVLFPPGFVVVPPVVWFGVVVPGFVFGVVGSTGVPGISVLLPWLFGSSTVPGFVFVWLLSCSSLPVAGKFCTCSPAASAWPLFFKNIVTPVAEAPIKTKDTSPITTFFVFKNFPFILTSIKILNDFSCFYYKSVFVSVCTSN